MPRGIPSPDPNKRYGGRGGWHIAILEPGDLQRRAEKALLTWRGPAEGGNPTLAEFVREAIQEKLARMESDKQKGPQ